MPNSSNNMGLSVVVRPNRFAPALAVFVVLLTGAGTWSYLYGILDVNWRAHRQGSLSQAYHSDLFPSWLGTREVLRHHADPYSKAVTESIQRGYYGHPLEEGSSVDPQAFAYPAHVMLFVAPFALLPFTIAARLFFVVLLLMTLSLVALFTQALNLHWNRSSQWLASAAVVASFPVAEALYVEQITILVIFVIAAGLAALAKGRLWLAGMLFAISTIKPQISSLLLAWLMLWAVTRWHDRYRLLVSFLVGTALLVFGAELLLPGWITKWLGAAGEYLRYPGLRTPAAWLVPQPLSGFVTILVVVAGIWNLWGWRSAEPPDEGFGFAVVVALSVTLVAMPIWPAFQYSQMLLIPAALVIADRWRNPLFFMQRILSFLMASVLAFSSAGAVFVSTAILVLRVPEQRLGHSIELPLFNFAVAPLVAAVAMTGMLYCSRSTAGTRSDGQT